MSSFYSEGRASLTALPAELRNKIYAYAFSGCRVRLQRRGKYWFRDDAAHRLPIALRFVSRAFYSDYDLLREFLRNATVVLVRLSDLQDFRERFSPEYLNLIRNICVSSHVQTPSTRGRHTPCREARCHEHHGERGWMSLDVASLSSTFPRLAHLSTDYCANHLEGFRQDFGYTLKELIKVIDKNTDPHLVNGHATDESGNDSSVGVDVPSDYSYQEQRFKQQLSRVSIAHLTFPAVTKAKSRYDILTQDMSRKLKAATESYARCTFGEHWYQALIRDATDRGIEITFDLTLIFTPESRGHDCPIFENLIVSNKDWILTLNVGGKVLKFKQDVV